MPNVYAVIMAGGVGARFWPRSRERSPKQLLEIFGKDTMLVNTVKRLNSVIEPDRILVVTNKVQKSLITKQIPTIPADNIIVEPFGRNTAPCIGLAALYLKRLDPEAVMVALPADHIIQNEDEFHRVLRLAIWVAYESGKLVTVGIQPTRPETGYGYIQFKDVNNGTDPYFEREVYTVKTFAEKPNLETAKKFIESGEFLWNSGMFIWRVDTILNEIQKSLPEMYNELMKIDSYIGTDKFDQNLELSYKLIKRISIDYGVMEKAHEVLVIKGEFGWSDVGSWDEVYRLSGKDDNSNSVTGKVMLHNSKNNLIYSQNKFAAVIDVEGLIIINTDDALLICKAGKSEDVKEVVDYLKRKQMDEYL